MTRDLLQLSDDISPDLAFWLRFEVQADEFALADWNRRAERNRGVCWSGIQSSGEKPVMRTHAQRLAAAQVVLDRVTAREAALGSASIQRVA